MQHMSSCTDCVDMRVCLDIPETWKDNHGSDTDLILTVSLKVVVKKK